MELTDADIETLQLRHDDLVGELREIARRLGEINEAIRTGQIAEGRPFDEIGQPIRERP